MSFFRVGSNYDDKKARIIYFLFQGSAELLSIHARHLDIRDENIRNRLADLCKRALTIRYRADAVAGLFQPQSEHPDQVRLVIGDEYALQLDSP